MLKYFHSEIERRLGDASVCEAMRPTGFSPGVAARLPLTPIVFRNIEIYNNTVKIDIYTDGVAGTGVEYEFAMTLTARVSVLGLIYCPAGARVD